MKKLLKKYELILLILKDNKKQLENRSSDYPYDHEIGCVKEFIKDIKKCIERVEKEKS